jgi:hypothetical protein
MAIKPPNLTDIVAIHVLPVTDWKVTKLEPLYLTDIMAFRSLHI